MKINRIFFLILLCVSQAATAADGAKCRAVGGTYSVKILELKPTQPSVGVGEVLKKAKKLAQADPLVPSLDDGETIPTVVGPEGKLYVTDHHHFVKALQLAKGSNALVQIKVTNNSFCHSCATGAKTCVEDFWTKMVRNRLAYTCSKDDQPVSYTQLPSGFGPEAKPRALSNDPLRTLVYVLRKKSPSGGYGPCVVRPETGPNLAFWEFRIAEKLRRSLPASVLTNLNSAENSQTTELSQQTIDAACRVLQSQTSSESCADISAARPVWTAQVTARVPSKSSKRPASH
jgi:hypothetical protein